MSTRLIKNPRGFESVEVYDSVKSLPILRTHDEHLMTLMDLGIGTNPESIASHFQKFYDLQNQGMYNDAYQEIINFQQSILYRSKGIDIPCYSFLTYVKAINKKSYEINKNTLHEDLKRISWITKGQVKEIHEEIKKKLIASVPFSGLISSETAPEILTHIPS